MISAVNGMFLDNVSENSSLGQPLHKNDENSVPALSGTHTSTHTHTDTHRHACKIYRQEKGVLFLNACIIEIWLTDLEDTVQEWMDINIKINFLNSHLTRVVKSDCHGTYKNVKEKKYLRCVLF